MYRKTLQPMQVSLPVYALADIAVETQTVETVRKIVEYNLRESTFGVQANMSLMGIDDYRNVIQYMYKLLRNGMVYDASSGNNDAFYKAMYDEFIGWLNYFIREQHQAIIKQICIDTFWAACRGVIYDYPVALPGKCQDVKTGKISSQEKYEKCFKDFPAPCVEKGLCKDSFSDRLQCNLSQNAGVYTAGLLTTVAAVTAFIYRKPLISLFRNKT